MLRYTRNKFRKDSISAKLIEKCEYPSDDPIQ